MTVGEIRDALAMFDPDTVVVVRADGEWSRTRIVGAMAVQLGVCVERCAAIEVDMIPAEESDDDDCSRCARLEAAIEEARNALENAE